MMRYKKRNKIYEYGRAHKQETWEGVGRYIGGVPTYERGSLEFDSSVSFLWPSWYHADTNYGVSIVGLRKIVYIRRLALIDKINRTIVGLRKIVGLALIDNK